MQFDHRDLTTTLDMCQGCPLPSYIISIHNIIYVFEFTLWYLLQGTSTSSHTSYLHRHPTPRLAMTVHVHKDLIFSTMSFPEARDVRWGMTMMHLHYRTASRQARAVQKRRSAKADRMDLPFFQKLKNYKKTFWNFRTLPTHTKFWKFWGFCQFRGPNLGVHFFGPGGIAHWIHFPNSTFFRVWGPSPTSKYHQPVELDLRRRGDRGGTLPEYLP
jgi:hypothetical protein